MAMNAQQKQQKAAVDRVRAFQKSSVANKRCADCVERGPTYVCADFHTFVCQTCSGLHREFGHKVRGISLTEWAPVEVTTLEKGGNERHNRQWMAKWKEGELAEPDNATMEEVRDFLKAKYEEKRWYTKDASPPPSAPQPAAVTAAPVAPASSAPQFALAAPAAAIGDLLSGDVATPAAAFPALSKPPVAAVVEAAPAAPQVPPASAAWTADFSSMAFPSPVVPEPQVPEAPGPAQAAPEAKPPPSAAVTANLAEDLFGLCDVLPSSDPPAAVKAAPPAPVAAPPVPVAAPPAPVVDLADDLFGLTSGNKEETSAALATLDAKVEATAPCLNEELIVASATPEKQAAFADLVFGGGDLGLFDAKTAEKVGFEGQREESTSPATKDSVSEPAEEPPPALAATAGQALDAAPGDTAVLGDQLEQALLGGSQVDLKQLYQPDPPKERPAEVQTRMKAYSAFDEMDLAGFGGEAGGAPMVHAASEPVVATQATVATAGVAASRQHRPPMDDPFAAAAATAPSVVPAASAVQAAVATSPAGLPQLSTSLVTLPAVGTAQAMPSTQAAPAMPLFQPQAATAAATPQQFGMVSASQLEQMDGKDLVQMQAMIQQALQARAQQGQQAQMAQLAQLQQLHPQLKSQPAVQPQLQMTQPWAGVTRGYPGPAATTAPPAGGPPLLPSPEAVAQASPVGSKAPAEFGDLLAAAGLKL